MSQKNESPNDSQSRRDFIKFTAAAGFGAALGGSIISGCSKEKAPSEFFTAKSLNKVRIGFVGVGGMGSVHVRNLLRIEGVELKAVCDIVEEKVIRAQNWAVEAGQPKPEGYSLGETDFKRMCERDDLDLVFNATPWKWHVPICVEAMNTGKHAATEVPAAYTLDDCWQLVETSEKTKKYCVMMENCCYNRPEMLVLNLVRKGMLGEILHGECGYLHDLRGIKFSNRGEGLWRLDHSVVRDGNLYPTHGLGPVAQCMNINRGDQFDYLVSMSTNSRGLNLYAEDKFGKDDPRALQKYALGDINVSLIRTVNGKTITLYHDCSSPRPYSRIHIVQGTKGIAERYPDRIYIEGTSPQNDKWEPMEDYYDAYEHPLHRAAGKEGQGLGHGSMDFLEDYRLIKALRTGTAPDMDVYDAASWSVVCALSEKSVANRGRPVDFPDFTRGAWRTREPLGIVTG